MRLGELAGHGSPCTGVGDNSGEVVVAGRPPGWPRSQQENSSENRGLEKTQAKRNGEESQTRRRGKEMENWEGP